MSLDFLVLNKMKELKSNNNLFTAYDITRILQQKDSLIDHNEVRFYVEYYYKRIGLERTVGYQLPFNPPPQIYHRPGVSIVNYNPNYLDPKVKVNLVSSGSVTFVPVKQSVTVVAKKSTETIHMYALVNKNSGERIVGKRSLTGLYNNKNGPTQIKVHVYNPDQYEVIKYKVTLDPVE